MGLSDADIATLTSLEEGLWLAATRFDMGWMENVLAADFFEIGRSGTRYSRQECLAIPASDFTVELPLPDLKIRSLSGEIAQVTYRSVFCSGGETLNGLRSSIWRRNGDRWELLFHQGTAI